ncbi:MAG TPA: hypothetical protein VNQ76_19690 [Planctomicrobium sp.]|nr:hypothetical protein [Planctomicrobium sp.]
MRAVCLLLIVFGIASCSGKSDAPEMAAVKGIVTWKGKPLADAGVVFTPTSGPVAIGRTDETGRFSLSTQGRIGAAVGAHRVTIKAYEPLPPGTVVVNDTVTTSVPVSRIPEGFGELENSGLVATVTSNDAENKFEFDLQ